MKFKLTLSLASLLAASSISFTYSQEASSGAGEQATEDSVAENANLEREAIVQKLTELLQDLEANGASLEKLEEIGDLYLQGGDPKRAILLYQKAIADYEGTEELFIKFARVMGMAGSSEHSVGILNVGLEKFPESEVLTFEIGKAYIGLKKPYAAVSNLKKVLEISPGKEEYRYYLADAYRQQKKWEEASEIIDGLIEDESELLEVYLMKGDLLLAQGERRDGVRYLEDLLEEHPESGSVKQILVHAYQLYAYAESQSGRLSRAVRSMRSALEVMPENAESHVALATFLHELGEYEEAEEAYKAALEQNPAYLDAYVLYGNMLEQLDRTPEAATLYQTGLSKSREAGIESAIATFRKLLGIRG